MKIIHQVHPEDFRKYDTNEIREKFLLEGLVSPDKLEYVYTHYDRMIVGAAAPVSQTLELLAHDGLKTDYFLQRREAGIINIGGPGVVTVDGEDFAMEQQDCLYVGMGKKALKFSSNKPDNPAKFIFFSCPAHQAYPVQHMKPSGALQAEMGSMENCNHRVINKYIHLDGLRSCQLVLGVTNFKPGSIWNTMPPHLHDRRMEAYFYFDLPADQRVIHFMGEPEHTRHIFLKNEEAILSPAWSIHSGVATASYSFIWAMAGENMVFTDMDPVTLQSLK